MKTQYIIVGNGQRGTAMDYLLDDLHWKGYSSAFPDDFAMVEPNRQGGYTENNYSHVPQTAMDAAKEIAADGEQRVLTVHGDKIVAETSIQVARRTIIAKLPDWEF